MKQLRCVHVQQHTSDLACLFADVAVFLNEREETLAASSFAAQVALLRAEPRSL
jgi:hypothetical protein